MPGQDYVSGRTIDYRGVVVGIFGALLAAASYFIASATAFWLSAYHRVSDGLAWYAAELVSAPLEAGAAQMTRVWQAGAEGLTFFGPFAFLVATLLVATTTMIFLWGVSRYV